MEELDFRIIPVEIQEEMKKSYIDYAMSIIVSRAQKNSICNERDRSYS